MDLAYAVLADNAEMLPNGKFTLFGAGIEVLHAHAFPAMVPALSLLIRLLVLREECEIGHELRLELLDSGGHNILPAGPPVSFVPHMPDSKFDLSPQYTFVFGFPGLVVNSPGKHTFRIAVDNIEVGAVPLYFERTSQSIQSDGEERKV